jgi:hypothetical protein
MEPCGICGSATHVLEDHPLTAAEQADQARLTRAILDDLKWED